MSIHWQTSSSKIEGMESPFPQLYAFSVLQRYGNSYMIWLEALLSAEGGTREEMRYHVVSIASNSRFIRYTILHFCSLTAKLTAKEKIC